MTIYGADYVASKNRNTRIIHGRVKGPNGSVTVVDGAGFTVAGGGTGIYVVTLDKAEAKYLGGAAPVIFSATTDLVAQITAYSIANGTVTYTVYKASTATATDLGSSDELWFLFVAGWSVRS